MKSLSWAVTTVLLLAGCASTSVHTPEPVAITDDMQLSEFATDSQIAFFNLADEPGRIEWRESAIKFMGDQLVKRGASVVEESQRSLGVEVVRVKRVVGATFLAPLAAPEGCEVTLKVKAGEDFTQEYFVRAGAYFWETACDKGVTKAIVSIFNDPEVRAHLELSTIGAVQ